MMKFVDLEYENFLSCKDSFARRQLISKSGKYLMGENVNELERLFAIDQGVRECVLVKNATDALVMTFTHLEANRRTVIVPQFGAYPTVVAALQAGAKRIIACAVDNSLTMDISSVDVPRNSIIVPVNLYGNSCNLKLIRSAADAAGECIIVEDCAQSTGLPSSGLSDYAIHSFYPTKPMGCMGDGGAILTNNTDAAGSLRKSRFYGINSDGVIDTWGMNSRIDEWQSAHLISKINHYRGMNEARRNNANRYFAHGNMIRYSDDCVFHQYVDLFNDREEARRFLSDRGIPTMIHYPKMLRDMPHLIDRVIHTDCKRVSDHVLSLPVGPHLNENEVSEVAHALDSLRDRRISFESIV